MCVFKKYMRKVVDQVLSWIIPKNDDGLYSVAPYVPSPIEYVKEMLLLSEIELDEVVYDLGSGDGRVVIMAAQEFGAKGVGVELKEHLVEKSTRTVSQLGLDDRVKIIRENLFDVDLRPADIVTLNLSGGANTKLKSKLSKELRDGTRVVSQAHKIVGWEPDIVKKIYSSSDSKYPRTIYLYVIKKTPKT